VCELKMWKMLAGTTYLPALASGSRSPLCEKILERQMAQFCMNRELRIRVNFDKTAGTLSKL
jgi:hypothetical protein